MKILLMRGLKVIGGFVSRVKTVLARRQAPTVKFVSARIEAERLKGIAILDDLRKASDNASRDEAAGQIVVHITDSFLDSARAEAALREAARVKAGLAKTLFLAIPAKHRHTVAIVGILAIAALVGYSIHLNHGLWFEGIQILKQYLLVALNLGQELLAETYRVVQLIPQWLLASMVALSTSAVLAIIVRKKSTTMRRVTLSQHAF